MQKGEERILSKPLELWNKCKSYEIVDGQLKGNKKIAEFLSPTEYSELPIQVAKLRHKNEKDLLKFVEAYGHFGYKQFDPFVLPYEEPLNWIWAHAEGSYLVLELLKLLQDSNFQELITFLERYESESDIKQVRTFKFTIGVREHILEEPYSVPLLNEEYATLVAENLISTIINKNIAGIYTEICKSTGANREIARFEVRNKFSAMIEVVYWHLLNATVGGVFRRCKECQTPFAIIHGSNEFCPKKSFEKESLCALKHRQKKRRAKLREKKQ